MNARKPSFSTLLLRFQRRRRTIRMRLGVPELSTTEAHILFALNESRPVTAVEVAASIGVEKSVLSRAIHKLEEKNFLESRKSEADGRRFNLTLLPEGREMLEKLDTTQEQILATCLRRLVQSEVDQLVRYVRRVADALDSPSFVSRQGDHPLTFQLRRLNSILDREANEQLPLMSLHLLDYLEENNDWVSVSDLSQSIGEELSMVSRALTALNDQGATTKRTNPNDARSSQYCLLREGRSLLDKIHSKKDHKLQRAMKGWPDEEKQDFFNLLESCSQNHEREQLLLMEERASLQLLKSEEELSEARAFYVEQLMRSNQISLLPDTLCSSSGLTYLYRRNSINRVVCAFEPPSDKQGRWRLCCLASTLPDTETDEKVLRPIAEMISGLHKIHSIDLQERTLSSDRISAISSLFQKARQLASSSRKGNNVLGVV